MWYINLFLVFLCPICSFPETLKLCFTFRSLQNPYYVNVLLAGYDSDVGASLYYIDYIATFHKIEKGAFGYGSYFCLSLMDKLYRPDMSVEEAVDLVDKCIKEIRLRLVVAPQNFIIKIVDKEGAREYARRAYTDSPPEAATSEAATVAAWVVSAIWVWTLGFRVQLLCNHKYLDLRTLLQIYFLFYLCYLSV